MKKAGCGGEEEREQPVNMPKDFSQFSKNHRRKWRCCVTHLPKLFQHILLSFWLLLLCWSHLSLFVLPCFQKESSVLTEMGHTAQHFEKQMLCCLQWESISGAIFGCFISGRSHKDESAWWTHALGCHHMVRAGNEGTWPVYLQFPWHCNVPTAFTETNLFSNLTRGKKNRNCIGFISYKFISSRTSLYQFFVSFFAWWDHVRVKSTKAETT